MNKSASPRAKAIERERWRRSEIEQPHPPGTFEPCACSSFTVLRSGERGRLGDALTLAALVDGFHQSRRRFDQLLLDIATSDAFALRRHEKE